MSAKNRDNKNRWRNITVGFRVSPEENELINKAVALSGLPKQEYCYRRCLNQDVVVQGNPRVFKALKTELSAVLTELKRIEAENGVDEELLKAAGILEYEKVQIVDVNNGSRFETYTICGERGSGMICLNGAAARCVSTGDKIIIMAYAQYEQEEARTHKPAVVFVDEENRISRVTNYEKHGLLKDMA